MTEKPFIEKSRGVYISGMAEVGEGVKFGDNVRVYGRVRIGTGALIDDRVQLGYPNPDTLRAVMGQDSSSEPLGALLDAAVSEVTEIGEHAIIRSGCVIYEGCLIGSGLDSAHHVVVRERCQLGQGVELGPFAYLKRDCKVGDYSRIASELCDRTIVGRHCTVYGRTSHKFLSGVSGEVESAPVLGDGVVVGRDACVVGSITIGDLAFIGAGAVVVRPVPPRVVVVGNPARVLRARRQDEAPDLWDRVQGP